MKYKTIGSTSGHLLSGLHREGADFFDIHQATRILPGADGAAVRKLLTDMVQRGLLMRLRDGLYHIIPYDREPDSYFPDWHVAASFLAGKTPHYVGYYSALVLHGLTTQPSLQEQVVVAKPIRPALQIVRGVSFQFIYHHAGHFFGTEQQWVQGIWQVPCSDLEKTLLDCAFKPENAGGIMETGKALYQCKDSLQPGKLLAYAARFATSAPVRRLGFLLEKLDILPELAQSLQALLGSGATYVALDTGLPKEGRSHRRWGIVENVEITDLQSALFT